MEVEREIGGLGGKVRTVCGSLSEVKGKVKVDFKWAIKEFYKEKG